MTEIKEIIVAIRNVFLKLGGNHLNALTMPLDLVFTYLPTPKLANKTVNISLSNSFEKWLSTITLLAGGSAKLTKQMLRALKNEEYQWALQLGDYLKWLDDIDKSLVRKGRITALRGLAEREYNAPNRNYYLSYANELESGKLSDLWF